MGEDASKKKINLQVHFGSVLKFRPGYIQFPFTHTKFTFNEATNAKSLQHKREKVVCPI